MMFRAHLHSTFLCMAIAGSAASLGAEAPAQAPGPAQAPAREPDRITLSVRDADLKDVLRAAAANTNFNLSFDAAADTRIKGLDLKAVTLDEILEQVLPSLGLMCVRTGRTLHIQKSDGGLRFYHVEYLSIARSGKKDYMVNASGQLIQVGGSGGSGGSSGGNSGGSGGGGSDSGGGSGSSSSYMSSLRTASGSDPWQELRSGLATLVFGGGVETSQEAAADGGLRTPETVSYSRDGKTLVIHPDSGLVMVGADPSTQARVARYLEEMRHRHCHQVILEARIVEVTLGNDSQIGVDWASVLTPGGASGGTGTDISGQFGTGGTINTNVTSDMGLARLVVQNARVTAALSALAREGRLQVLSAPRLVTLNNQKAILRVVREEAFFMQNSTTTGSGGVSGFSTTVNITPMVVPVGIILDIQPQIAEDGVISLAVNPSVSEIVTVRSMSVQDRSGVTIASANLPVVDRRDLDTVVRMRNGETLVLAGIIKSKDTVDDRGVPWLRRIPLLGNLFTKKEKSKAHTELAIFITPTLVEDAGQVEAQRKASETRLEKAGADLDPQPVKREPISVP
jgi:MSHA biogenesis protein MshL